VEAAGEIVSMMNLSRNPCEDFYEYACGNYIATAFLPPDSKRYGTFDILDLNNKKVLYKVSIKYGTSSVLEIYNMGVTLC